MLQWKFIIHSVDMVFVLVIRMFNVIIIEITKLGARNGSLSHIKNVIDQTHGKEFVWK